MDRADFSRLKKELQPIAKAVAKSVRDPESTRAFLEEWRGRPVYLLPSALRARTIGAWVEAEEADYILFERAAHPRHQRHIVLHEAAHMLRGHSGLSEEEMAALLLPGFPLGFVRSIACHAAMNTPEDEEAELLAVLIEARIERLEWLTPADDSSASRNVMKFMATVGGME